MTIHSTLLYKQRDKIQIQILRKIATDGKQSKKSLEIKLEKHHPVIDNAVNQLLRKELITRAEGDQNNKRGKPEKFYRLSKKGIEVLVDEIKISPNEFWEMIFRIFDSDGDYITYGYFNSKNEYVEEDHFVLENLTIEHLIEKYENSVLRFNRKLVIPNIFPKISNIRLITSCKLTSTEKGIIEILTSYDSLSIDEISSKLHKPITKIPKKILRLFLIKENDETKKYQITLLGIQYFLFVSFKQFKSDIQMKKISIILKHQKNILPLIFRKWKWLTRYFSNKELLNILINSINVDHRQPPFQTNLGIQEILDNHRNLEEVSKNKISYEYEVGYDAYSKIRNEKIINLKSFHSQKTEKIKNYSKMISTILDPNSKNKLHKVDKSLQTGYTELDKLKILSRYDSIDDFYPDEIKKQHKTMYEQNKTDSLSFRFYCILSSQIYQKKIGQKEWFTFLKTDKDIMPWYGNKIKEIEEFEKNNAKYREDLVNICV